MNCCNGVQTSATIHRERCSLGNDRADRSRLRRLPSARLPKDQPFPIAGADHHGLSVRSLPSGPLSSQTRRRHRLRKFLIGATEFQTCGILHGGAVWLRIHGSRADCVRGGPTGIRHRNRANEPKITRYRDRENEATIMPNQSIVRANSPLASKSSERTQDDAAENCANEATIMRTKSIVRAERPTDADGPCSAT